MAPRPVPASLPPPLLPAFYAGRSVFITGASGFMGKVLVERLLATCPRVHRLHLLMRHKRNVPPEKRLAALKQSPVFDNIRARCPAQLDKLRVVAGDTALPELGIAAEELAQLSEVSIVFHSAATLRFDEPLAAAVEQNVRSVVRVMDLCDLLPHVEALVHVSTAYSNTERGARVEERVYPAPAPLPELLALADAVPPHILAEITQSYIHPKPNTYTFTKAMAESAVEQRTQRRYPVAIFRPSIVISSVRDPFPGWIENLNGPAGVVVGAGKGLLHALSCSLNARADMVPVDIAIDTLLAVAWETATDNLQEARVYNCCSTENPTTWGHFKDTLVSVARRHPFDGVVWYPFGVCFESLSLHRLTEWLLQAAPLRSADFVTRLCGIKMKLSLVTACERLRAMSDVLRFFALREWRFDNGNVQRLRARLSPADAAIYNLDPRTIDWEKHTEDFVKGARKYLLREKDEDIPKAQSHMRKLYVVHWAVVCGGAALLLRLLLRLLLPQCRRLSARLPSHLAALLRRDQRQLV